MKMAEIIGGGNQMVMQQNVRFDVGSVTVGVFQDVSGFAIETKIAEVYMTNPQGKTYKTLQTGSTTYSSGELKRGLLLGNGKDMFDWLKKAQEGSPDAYQNASLVFCDMEGNAKFSLDLIDAIPTKWSLGGPKGEGASISVESITVNCTRIDFATA
jgi:phage tail-like protein